MGKKRKLSRVSRAVPEVVTAPSAFPDPYTSGYTPRIDNGRGSSGAAKNGYGDVARTGSSNSSREKEFIKMKKTLMEGETDLDFDKMFKEVKSVGSSQFTGYQKKLHKEAEYREITGMKKVSE